MRSFNGIEVHVVDEGTELDDPHSGDKHVVTEGNAVREGLFRIYMVHSDHEKLKRKAQTPRLSTR